MSGQRPRTSRPEPTREKESAMLRLAIIGAGRIGQVHARTIYAHPGAELVTIVDPSPGAAASLADTFGAKGTESVEDVYGDDTIDARDGQVDRLLRQYSLARGDR